MTSSSLKIELALALRRDGRALRGRGRRFAEHRRQPQRIAVRAERREAERRDDDVAVLLGELVEQAVGLSR